MCWGDIDSNELVLTFGVYTSVSNFGEHRQRNATVRVTTHGQTHRHTDRQTQTDFIICRMLHAIAMGQIIIIIIITENNNIENYTFCAISRFT